MPATRRNFMLATAGMLSASAAPGADALSPRPWTPKLSENLADVNPDTRSGPTTRRHVGHPLAGGRGGSGFFLAGTGWRGRPQTRNSQ
jgi:hypothetical protein